MNTDQTPLRMTARFVRLVYIAVAVRRPKGRVLKPTGRGSQALKKGARHAADAYSTAPRRSPEVDRSIQGMHKCKAPRGGASGGAGQGRPGRNPGQGRAERQG